MRRSHGFSLLELVVVIAIISVLVAVALDRLLPYLDEAERVAVLRVEGQLRSQLMLEAAERIVRGEAATITDLEGSNPVNFLLEPPKNYLGTVTGSDELPGRHWGYDEHRRQLVYRLGEAYALDVTFDGLDDPAFSVRVAFADRDGDRRFEPLHDELYGVRLERVAGSAWLSGAVAN